MKHISNSLVSLVHFCLRKNTQKSKFSKTFLLPGDPLVATFNETCAPSSRKYVAEQGIVDLIFSKIYERCHYDQMYKYFNFILSKWECGFRKGFSTQHCLLVMTEKWRKCLDKVSISGDILTDLSKAFDCILHDLLVAKLSAYSFDYQSQNHGKFSFR